MANRTPDFKGWATKYNIKCSDGRTILPGAFADMDGKKVPIVFGHIHDDPDMILGHAILHSRDEGIYMEGYLNNNPKATSIRGCLSNEDVDGLSIYANELKHVNGRQVQHGNIREVSIVLAGANKGATIENVILAHADGFEEYIDDEVIVYNDDIPLMHGEDDDPPPADSQDENEPEENEPEDPDDGDDGDDDDGDDDDFTVEDILNTMDEDQRALCDILIDRATGEDMHEDISNEDLQAVLDSMDETQQEALYYLIGQTASDEDDDGEDDGEDDAAEHSTFEEDDDMKENVFDRNKKTHPDDFLSHEDQEAIIKRGRELGSMRKAWEEALVSNDTLAHSVFNDDGTEQTYGVANIDYLFPEYTELNSTPEMIRRDDEWVAVIMNGVTKTPHARMKTTMANITMEEARAKGYTKGDKKDPEVFNLLHRQVSPQTIYKYQEIDQDDVIDITDFDVIAWVKAEMRIMLNEEVARAILIGDGRVYNDKYKIKPEFIKPIVDDDDLYAIKLTVTPGSTGTDDQKAAATAENAIKAMIRGRKHYKGSGNLVFFTSEDWLAEWLLLEDGFGHAKYEDASKLAKKLRVNRIVTCPFLEDLVVDGQKVMGIAIDLKDYGTGTDRRGKITFFDDFDIEYNKNQYLIETRLSGMIRKPFSAMILKIGTAEKGGPHYDEVSPVGNENPKTEGWYEHEGAIYRPTADTTVKVGKTYYARSTNVNP